ncbi:MAG TPA: family 43 glycosylhydrolase [Firmicutes bacterium]|nr:family 43 glycosylhydrolase [Bacillota bacterium]
MTYKNPLAINNIGDPFVLKASDSRYYCYPTSGGVRGFKVWTSTDLVNWVDKGVVYQADEDTWGHNRFWAPEVVEYQGKFYMYYTAGWRKNDSLRIGIAVSDSPLGPFVDVLEEPLFDFGYAAIDAHVFIDDDDQKYLYYSRDCSENIVEGRHESHIYGIKLDDDMLSVSGQPILLTKPEQEWELKSGPKWRWNEGAFVLKHKGMYYLMYSANCYAGRDYSVGYAVSEHPLGPFVKYEGNPILASNNEQISGPGHHSVTLSPDNSEMFIVYHIHTDPKKGGGNRQVCIDRMGFNPDGTIWVAGPTITEQPLPR